MIDKELVNKIKVICSSTFTEDKKKIEEILQVLSEDERSISWILYMLSLERTNDAEIRDELNQELSRAHVYIAQECKSDRRTRNSKGMSRAFMLDKIKKFYLKNKGKIYHSFAGAQFAKDYLGDYTKTEEVKK